MIKTRVTKSTASSTLPSTAAASASAADVEADAANASNAPSKPWYLYLLECQGGTYYAGITTNVQKRYQTHVSGKGAKYTRARKPKRLLGARVYINRSEAAKAEYAIKQLDKRDKPVFLQQVADAVSAPFVGDL